MSDIATLPTILLVDDDDVDVQLIQRAFKKRSDKYTLEIAKDGLEALERLRGENGLERPTQPFIILLDLNMPRMSGLQFLKEIRSDETLRRHVVFVLTTSNADQDKLAAYDSCIAGYLLKEDAGSNFEGHLPLIERYCESVRFPPEGKKSGGN